jgi:hypothetical protein
MTMSAFAATPGAPAHRQMQSGGKCDRAANAIGRWNLWPLLMQIKAEDPSTAMMGGFGR